jgi:hypothetical protein
MRQTHEATCHQRNETDKQFAYLLAAASLGNLFLALDVFLPFHWESPVPIVPENSTSG